MHDGRIPDRDADSKLTGWGHRGGAATKLLVLPSHLGELPIVSEEEPQTSDWRRPALFTVEDVQSAVRRAGQAVYGSDERLDHLLKETRRFLERGRRAPDQVPPRGDHLRGRGTDWD